MTDRTIYYLYVDVFENGSRKDISDFPSESIDDICTTIETLWSPTYTSSAEFSAVPSEEGDLLYLVYTLNDVQAAFPSDWIDREVTIGVPGKTQETLRLIGDRIPITSHRLGVDRIHVQFSDV